MRTGTHGLRCNSPICITKRLVAGDGFIEIAYTSIEYRRHVPWPDRCAGLCFIREREVFHNLTDDRVHDPGKVVGSS